MFVPYDKAPEPIGGFAAVQKNLDYPEISRRAGIQGMVIVQALVDSTGEITDTKIAKSLGAESVLVKPFKYEEFLGRVKELLPVTAG